MSRPIVLFLVFFLVPPFAWALDGEAILRQVDRKLNPESYEMYRKLVNIEPDGRKKEFVLFSVKKGRDRMVALFLDPPSDKGRATLRLGDNMWLYIPSVGKPIRITSLQSVVGGVFNNADILNLDYSVEYGVEKATEEGKTYVLELKARSGAVAYDRLKMRVDRASLTPTEIECYAASGLLIKTLRFKDLKDFGGGLKRPATMETDSPLYKGYKSLMLYGSIKARALPDEVFTLDYLPRASELR
ncbi:MAG TPA: outer membrane lipoprotein-sorting protein [Burkholderiales bacterium]|nr:outer membrane lipoprotein-sorting protein [Burkholderiales bacterium]